MTNLTNQRRSDHESTRRTFMTRTAGAAVGATGLVGLAGAAAGRKSDKPTIGEVTDEAEDLTITATEIAGKNLKISMDIDPASPSASTKVTVTNLPVKVEADIDAGISSGASADFVVSTNNALIDLDTGTSSGFKLVVDLPQADANLGITLDGVSASAGPVGVSVSTPSAP